jgi:hypothetical protein
MNLIAITNPSDESAEAGFVHSQVGHTTVESIIPEYGDKIEDGAQIVIVDDGPDPRVWQYIAERAGDEIFIRANNTIALYIDTEEVGPCIVRGSVAPATELETFTVFGNNDYGEHFVAVVAATEETVYDVGVQAGLVEGYENSVSIAAILKGNQSHLERVKV